MYKHSRCLENYQRFCDVLFLHIWVHHIISHCATMFFENISYKYFSSNERRGAALAKEKGWQTKYDIGPILRCYLYVKYL